jgi:prolyl oligopeptidase
MNRSPLSLRVLPALVAAFAFAFASPAMGEAAPDDPYQWLEPFGGERVMNWVQEQNARTLAVLEKDPHYDGFWRDALALAEARDRIPAPHFLAGSLFNFWQDADHVRGIWRRTSAAGYGATPTPWTTVLDLDALAAQEHANWVWKGADCERPAERRCLLMLSDGGEDAVTIREFDVRTGRLVAGGFELARAKQRTAWEDGGTLLVAREFEKGQLTTSGYPYVVKRLKRGAALDQAQEIFRGRADDGGYGVQPYTLVDAAGQRALIIERPLTTFESEYYLVSGSAVRRLALPAKVNVHALVAGRLVVEVKEDWQAGGVAVARGAVVALELSAVKRDPGHLRPEIVYAPGAREAVRSVRATRDAVLVDALDNVQGRLFVLRRAKGGLWSRERIKLPENSTVTLVDADADGNGAFVDVSGFLQPSSLWSVDARRLDAVRLRTLPAKFDASQDVVEQFEAVSSDGVRIPYFCVHRAGMALDGSHPTVLGAYGGFDVPVTPNYSPPLGKLWLERGGVYVLANIRGGGEFGPAWHEAGLKTRRQIIYDDFTAVARDLIARGITSPRRLGIRGGSNGGLLMGVEMTQHPELWTAVDIAVPLLDMLRYEQIAAGSSWVGEYGSVAVPEEREFLERISPYAQLRRGVAYPEAFVWTTTKDDRVGPQHARKFAARLAEFGVPYLFYEVTEGGHGAGANLRESARTNALEWTYFARKLEGE